MKHYFGPQQKPLQHKTFLGCHTSNRHTFCIRSIVQDASFTPLMYIFVAEASAWPSGSPFHRLEMTEILLKGRKTLTHPIHPYLWPSFLIHAHAELFGRFHLFTLFLEEFDYTARVQHVLQTTGCS